MTFTATYSPDDNKLRLYASSRLETDLYARVRAAGFIWAPKQDLFVAPMWTPERADLLEELAGEIGDEDTSLVDRAEDRADRFGEYHEARAIDAAAAHKAVAAIADGIPLGQPILVGHHSERHARKDAERIENGMRRAIKMWETAQYWKGRAAGAIRHAKYKERPDVRARRIKGLEADHRKQAKIAARAEWCIRQWNRLDDPTTAGEPPTPEQRRARARQIANVADHGYFASSYTHASGYVGPCSYWDALKDDTIGTDAIRDRAIRNNRLTVEHANRWIAHIAGRLEYERAMLADAGGTVADKTGPEVGGACRCWASPRGGWSYIRKVNKVSVTVLDNWGNGGRNFPRTIPFDKLSAVMTAADVQAVRDTGQLIDSAYKDEAGTVIGFVLRDGPPNSPPSSPPPRQDEPTPAAEGMTRADADALRDTLKTGVKVVTAPQLFPTPADLARHVVELADVQPGQRVLEPSAGTGNLIRAVIDRLTGTECGHVVAVEINRHLAEALRGYRAKLLYANADTFDILTADFLELTVDDLGTFDRIVMNPPFERGADIQHIEHACTLLRPGGRLVAICAAGPRQREAFEHSADDWIDLPAGSFEAVGTGVHTAIVVFRAETVEQHHADDPPGTCNDCIANPYEGRS